MAEIRWTQAGGEAHLFIVTDGELKVLENGGIISAPPRSDKRNYSPVGSRGSSYCRDRPEIAMRVQRRVR